MISRDEKEEKKMAKVKPMSASEEKKLDYAIAMANDIAAKTVEDDPYTPRTPKTPKAVELMEYSGESGPESPSKLKARFSFKFPSKKSPKVEKRNFTEQMENVPSVEDVSPEAQDAYNLLVVKGTAGDSKASSGASSVSSHGSPTSPRTVSSQSKRERRMRRSLEHQTSIHRTSVSSEVGDTDSRTFTTEHSIHITRNMKEPAGIPVKSSSSVSDTSRGAGGLNPLRMLRDNSAMSQRVPRAGPRQMVSRTSSNDSAEYRSSGALRFPTHSDSARHRHNVASRNTDTGSRRYDEEYNNRYGNRPALPDNKYLSHLRDLSNNNDKDEEVNPLPLPPKPANPSLLYQAPRERKFPLVSDSNYHASKPPITPASPSTRSPVIAPMATAEDEDDEVEAVFCGTSSDDRSYSASPRTLVPQPHVAMKFVKCNAQDMGIYDNDPFWKEKVDFEEAGKQSSRPLPGRYKTSDNVSYEDLLDFALADDNKEDGEKNCKEVEAIQKVLSKQVPVSTCMDALNETQWDVLNAIKYIKMKQLLSTQLGDVEHCKEALLSCNWDVHEAADYMLTNPSYSRSPSPECVDL